MKFGSLDDLYGDLGEDLVVDEIILRSDLFCVKRKSRLCFDTRSVIILSIYICLKSDMLFFPNSKLYSFSKMKTVCCRICKNTCV